MADMRLPAGDSGGVIGNAVGRMRRHLDPAIASAFGCIVIVLFVGSLYSTSFLSPVRSSPVSTNTQVS